MFSPLEKEMQLNVQSSQKINATNVQSSQKRNTTNRLAILKRFKTGCKMMFSPLKMKVKSMKFPTFPVLHLLDSLEVTLLKVGSVFYLLVLNVVLI